MQTRDDRHSFQGPFSIVSIKNDKKSIVLDEYQWFDKAGMDMLKIRAGFGRGFFRGKQITQKTRDGELGVVDSEGYLVYKLSARDI